MKYGLSNEQLTKVADILASYPQIESATIFGSRAIETFKDGSDVDIVIGGKEVDYRLSLKVGSRFEDSTLPFFFDIIAYSTIQSEDLKEHIRTKGKVIYRKE